MLQLPPYQLADRPSSAPRSVEQSAGMASQAVDRRWIISPERRQRIIDGLCEDFEHEDSGTPQGRRIRALIAKSIGLFDRLNVQREHAQTVAHIGDIAARTAILREAIKAGLVETPEVIDSLPITTTEQTASAAENSTEPLVRPAVRRRRI